MTKAVQKITLLPSQDIPFDKLVLSQSNVRGIKAGVSINELAKAVARHGLLQSLTETSVRVSDRRPAFVGVDAYEAAGGTMLHDLFQSDDGGWLEDPALLDRLVTEKLQAEAETVAVEGWKWIEVALDLPYGFSHGLRSMSSDPAPMTDDEGAAHAKLLAEYRALEDEYAGQDELPDQIDTRLGVLEAEMEKIDARPLIFDPTKIRRAGAFVTLDRSGALAVYRGYVRPEDEPVEETAVQDGPDPPVAGQEADRGLADGHASGAHVGTIIMSGIPVMKFEMGA